jgi:SAM-dependent methyltransferase
MVEVQSFLLRLSQPTWNDIAWMDVMEKVLYRQYYEIEDRHWWFVGRKTIVLGLLDDYLAWGSERVALDAGCGTGGLLQDLQRYGKVVAVDFSEEAVRFCKLRGYEIIQCSVLKTPFQAESFDCIVGFDLLEHLDEDLSALQELYRICKCGGYLCVTVPAYQFLWSHHDELNHHKRRYTKSQLTIGLQSARFQVVRCSYFNTFLFPFILLGRLFGQGAGEEPGPEWSVPSRVINTSLSRAFSAELRLLRSVALPFGASIFAIAKKA